MINRYSCGAFCHLAFSASRLRIRPYERAHIQAATLGAAFRERRWSRNLDQRATAAEIGVTLATYRKLGVERHEAGGA
jgi:hypothetical protein